MFLYVRFLWLILFDTSKVTFSCKKYRLCELWLYKKYHQSSLHLKKVEKRQPQNTIFNHEMSNCLMHWKEENIFRVDFFLFNSIVSVCILKLLQCNDSHKTTKCRFNVPILLLRSWIGSSAFWTGFRLNGYWSCTSAFSSKITRHIMHTNRLFVVPKISFQMIPRTKDP